MGQARILRVDFEKKILNFVLKLTDLSGYRIRDKIVFSSLVKSVTSVIRLKNEQILYKNCLIHGSVTDQEKDLSFFFR